MTLNGVMAIILRYFAKFGSFRGQLRTANWSRASSYNSGYFRNSSALVSIEIYVTFCVKFYLTISPMAIAAWD